MKWIKVYAIAIIQYFAAGFLLLILLLIKNSCRFTKLCDAESSKNIIYLMWHNSSLGMIPLIPHFQKNKTLYAMVSGHKSTTLMRYAFKILGCKIVDGSRHQGYISSIKQMLSIFENTNSEKRAISITPDGPRGPSFEIPNDTLFKIAKKYNVEIRFVCSIADRMHIFNTWDKLYIHLPFTNVTLVDKILFSNEELRNFTADELRILCQERMRKIVFDLYDKYSHPKPPVSVRKKRIIQMDER